MWLPQRRRLVKGLLIQGQRETAKPVRDIARLMPSTRQRARRLPTASQYTLLRQGLQQPSVTVLYMLGPKKTAKPVWGIARLVSPTRQHVWRRAAVKVYLQLRQHMLPQLPQLLQMLKEQETTAG